MRGTTTRAFRAQGQRGAPRALCRHRHGAGAAHPCSASGSTNLQRQNATTTVMERRACGASVVMRAGKSDLSSLFDGTPSTKAEKKKEEAKEEGVTEVELKSERGLSYELLRDLLAAGEWEKADNETRLKLIQMAGEDAEERGWVYFTEVKDIPVADLETVDKLWLAYSNGRYGYSVQKKIWVKSRKIWTKFFQEIDWVQGENNAYRKWPLEFIWTADAKKGHMPLTNALRGTQLLQAVLEHPAFEDKKKKKVATSIGKDSIKI